MKKQTLRTVFVSMCVTLLVLVGSTAFANERINLQALMAKRVPVLLEFGRGWCKPCKYMKPILDDMERAYAGRAIVKAVDMDANADLVRSFGIRVMPTQIFLMSDGREFMRNEGTLEREQIMQIFSKMGLAPPRLGAAR